MPVLNIADAVYAGTGTVQAIYYGSTEVYNIGGGGDPDPEPTPEPPVQRAAWQNNPSANGTITLNGTQAGDTIFVAYNLNGTPDISAPGVTFSQVFDTGGNTPLRLRRGVVSTSGNKTITYGGGGASNGALMAGAYVGDVTPLTESDAGEDNAITAMTVPGLAVPEGCLALGLWTLVSSPSTWNGQINAPSGWTLGTQGRMGSGGEGTRVGVMAATRSFPTGGNTGAATATASATVTGTVRGWRGAIVPLITA